MSTPPDNHLKTIVVDVHYEADHKTHPFSSDETWSQVHDWACDKFSIADDACPNLELRADSPTGGLLSENGAIGSSAKQRTVWLVKPGPDQFGHEHTRR